jgi:hypothetical protein
MTLPEVYEQENRKEFDYWPDHDHEKEMMVCLDGEEFKGERGAL